ncbi:MAG: histidinol-phosphate transaminase [Candidatus Poriferisodalaceae bacterium]|nr:MAG: histidinol-phosphate transaminase [Acidimicrobiales bacterium MED-G01]|tara:strand:- start:399 stop:1475 length:1077 start_codon:yes stop_codon:yes gene_type:complete
MRRPLVRDDLKSMEGYHSPQVDVEVRLNTNEAPFAPPDEFQEAFINEVKKVDWNRYPDRLARSLREDLAALHQVDSEQVFVANGSNEVLQTICLTFGGHGRTALTFEPTYAMYGQIARTTQCRVAEVQRDETFRISLDVLQRGIETEKPDVMFLCSPNNPTGTPESAEVVEAALDLSSAAVVVDEAYGQFADFTALDMFASHNASESLIVTRTFSKTWSMAGVRLGYCVAPSWMLDEFQKVVLPYHLDSVKQIAGRVALRFQDQMEKRVTQIAGERQRVSEALTLMELEVWPSQANFILFRTTSCDIPGGEVWKKLLDKSVLVRNCSTWPGLDDCLRVTLGTEQENTIFLEALEEALL